MVTIPQQSMQGRDTQIHSNLPQTDWICFYLSIKVIVKAGTL